MVSRLTQEDKIKSGAEDSGRYFHYMAEFVGFTAADAQAIKESQLVVEKYIPQIVASFYDKLLRYPPTRKFFLKSDGSLDQEYLQVRMQHLTNFWRRTASGVYDDDYARYVDYVGRAHTSRGADPHIYIAERYVIGQVGYVQHAISEALTKELHEYDPDLEARAVQAWNTLMMVILELLARAYGNEREAETFGTLSPVDFGEVKRLAVDAYERGLGISRTRQVHDVVVARASDIQEGERKLVEVDGVSIGVFHHKGGWYAVRNFCLHRGGPVATGSLEGDTLTCPWHGFQYNLTNGRLLADSSAKLETYPVTIVDGDVHLQILVLGSEPEETVEPEASPVETALAENEFLAAALAPGQSLLLHYDGQPIVVFNVGGKYFATQNACTHMGGPLNEGELAGDTVTCPWHGSRFDVTSGKVVRGPASQPLDTFKIELDGAIGRVKESGG